MPRVCKVTGKKTQVGMNVSHSMRHTKRTFLPNLQIKVSQRYLESRFFTAYFYGGFAYIDQARRIGRVCYVKVPVPSDPGNGGD